MKSWNDKLNKIIHITILNMLQIKKLNHAFDIPKYGSEKCSGMDLFSANEEDIVIYPNEVKLIPTGICIKLPDHYEAQIRPRSGLALKNCITVLNTPGTIDEDYRGEIKVILINHGTDPFIVKRGFRIAQMVISKYYKPLIETVESLSETKRSSDGFGSTGV